MFSCCVRPKKVKEDLDVYSFTFNAQRPPMGSIEAKYITSLLDSKGVSVVATKEIFCNGKPNMVVFSVLPTYPDDNRNNADIKNIQNLVNSLTTKKLKVCLYFLQLKTESSLMDSSAAKFDGLSASEFRKKKGYEEKVPICAAVVLEQVKEVCERLSIPVSRTILMGLGAGGCLVLNTAFAQYNEVNLGGYCCVDSYLPRNFNLKTQFSHKLMGKPTFLSNTSGPKDVPSNWGNETFNDLRAMGLRPSSSCFFSIRSKANNYWDYIGDWLENYVTPYLDGKEAKYRAGRRVSWAPEDVLEDYIEYELESEDEFDYETESLHSLVLGF